MAAGGNLDSLRAGSSNAAVDPRAGPTWSSALSVPISSLFPNHAGDRCGQCADANRLDGFADHNPPYFHDGHPNDDLSLLTRVAAGKHPEADTHARSYNRRECVAVIVALSQTRVDEECDNDL